MALIPIRFINQEVEVQFDQPQLLEKTPGCPDGFAWHDEQFQIVELISEWRDYRRQGRMGRNMRPEHATTAARRGSWGVGQFYFRVRTQQGQIFDLYYDRAPKDVDRRKGAWFLDKELGEKED
jgi:hypothetical protein